MKSIWNLLFLVFVCNFTFESASALSIDDLNFNYIKHSMTDEAFEKNLLLGSLSKSLEGKLISQVGIAQPFLVDEIFSSQDMTKSVFLKMGYKVNDETFQNQVTNLNEGYLYHSTTKSGLHYALMFKGFEINEVHETINSLRYTKYSIPEKTKRNFWSSIDASLISRAHAQENCDPNDPNFVQRMVGHFNSNPGLRCLMGAFRGAWDSTGGAVIGLAKGAYNLITAPVQSAKAVWASASSFYRGVQAFFNDAQGMMREMYSNFDSLPLTEKSEIACRVASAIGTGVLVTFFTGGFAGPAVLLRIASALRMLQRTSGVLRVIPLATSARIITRAARNWQLMHARLLRNPRTAYEVQLNRFNDEFEAIYAPGSGIRFAARTDLAAKEQIARAERELRNVKAATVGANATAGNLRLVEAMENVLDEARRNLLYLTSPRYRAAVDR